MALGPYFCGGGGGGVWWSVVECDGVWWSVVEWCAEGALINIHTVRRSETE